MADEDNIDDLFSTPDAWEEEHPDDSSEAWKDEDAGHPALAKLGSMVLEYLEQAAKQPDHAGKVVASMVEIVMKRDWFDQTLFSAAMLRCFVLAFNLRLAVMGQQITPEWLGQSIIEAARADLKAQREAN